MKLTLEEKIHKHKISKPKKFLATIVGAAFKASVKKNNCHHVFMFDKKQYIDQPVMFLCQHASYNDYLYVGSALRQFYPCIVCGHNHVVHKGRFNLMLNLDVIPKSLYHKDPYTITTIYRAVKKGRSICLFPEGIQSTSGSEMPLQPGTEKLLKKLGIPVIVVKSNGAYLTRPRFSKQPRIGKITYTYKVLFTKEDLKDLSNEQIYQRMQEEFIYNDLDYNKTARIPYVGKEPNATGLDRILFVCPKCGKEFGMKIIGDSLTCECGNTITVNEYYDLIPQGDSVCPADIDKWYKWQREHIQKQIANPDFVMSTQCIIKTIDSYKLYKDPLRPSGTGVITLRQDGLHYNGTLHGQAVELFMPIEKIPSAPFAPGIDFDVKCDDEFYSFEPTSNKLQVVKWMVTCEELHKKRDRESKESVSTQ